MKVCPVCGAEYGEDAAFCSRDRSPLRVAGETQGLVGQLVGERYQVERRLGEGGMGEVYLARHVLMGRPCALKVMNRTLSRDPDAVTRFNREATSASSISHPNVATVYDFGLTADGLVYLAMEYVEGQTLSQLLSESGPMPLDRASALLVQCAAGLQAAHDLGIVHRDLKPENVMVISAKQRETAKLVDFGIAKAREGAAGQRVTKSGYVVGTPEYMSPEQLSGDPVDTRSDQYSLALLFYRLLTGKLPFEGSSLQETLVKRLTDPPRPLAQCLPGAAFPAGLQAVLDRALARQAEQRFQNVVEFAGAISALAAQDHLATRKLKADASAVPVTMNVATSQRRSRWAMAGLGVVLLSAGTWALVTDRAKPGGTTDADSTSAVPPQEKLAGNTTAPAPAPVPPAAAANIPATQPVKPTVQAVDTTPLNLDTPESATEIARAERQLSMNGLSAERRAEAAYFLGQAALTANRRDSALAMYNLAYTLHPKSIYLQMIKQLRDTLRP